MVYIRHAVGPLELRIMEAIKRDPGADVALIHMALLDEGHKTQKGAVYITVGKLKRKEWVKAHQVPPRGVRGGRGTFGYKITTIGLEAIRRGQQARVEASGKKA